MLWQLSSLTVPSPPVSLGQWLQPTAARSGGREPSLPVLQGWGHLQWGARSSGQSLDSPCSLVALGWRHIPSPSLELPFRHWTCQFYFTELLFCPRLAASFEDFLGLHGAQSRASSENPPFPGGNVLAFSPSCLNWSLCQQKPQGSSSGPSPAHIPC